MTALHGAPEAPRFVPKGSAVPTLHLWVEGNKVSESAEPTGACAKRTQGQMERDEHWFWRKDRSTRPLSCQDIYDTVVFPKASAREHQRRKGWYPKCAQQDPD